MTLLPDLAWFSPLPPVRSGIANYSKIMLNALSERAKITLFTPQESIDEVPGERGDLETFDSARFDAIVYQLGNNLHHDFVYEMAMKVPGVLVLHDLVLNHLLTEITLARGDADGYVTALEANHGAAGRAFATARASGLHYEPGNFLFPASTEVCNRSKAVIVHNSWSRDRLIQNGVSTEIVVVEHPVEKIAESTRPLESPFPEGSRIVSALGFVTEAKRPEAILKAFASARRTDPTLRLAFVGEPAANVDLESMARDSELPPDSWRVTGYVTDQEFTDWIGASDRVVSLRYPTAGESSGPLVRVFAAGKPVAVSDYAQFHDLDPELVSRIPIGDGEIEALAEFMTTAIDVDALATLQRAWIRERADVSKVAGDYMEVVRKASSGSNAPPVTTAPSTSLGLLPMLTVVDTTRESDGVRLTIRNDGQNPLRSIVYGSAVYQIEVVIRRSGQEPETFAVRLDGDLEHGETREIRVPAAIGDRIELFHGHMAIPRYPTAPFHQEQLV